MDDPARSTRGTGSRVSGSGSQSAPRSRQPLSRQRIVQVAIEFVDQHGLSALTMRRVAQELGVEAMSLYHYINGREDLLEAIVDHLVEGVRIPPESVLGPRDGWQGYIQRLGRTVRGLALDHPSLFPLVATRPPSAPWLRPPLRSLRLVEDFLTALVDRGVSEEHAVLAYKEFSSFLLGHLLLEVAAEGAPVSPDDEPMNEGGADGGTPDSEVDVTKYPLVVRLTPRLQRHDPTTEFQKGMEDLLDRLDRLVSQ